jgi:hypothetical protein
MGLAKNHCSLDHVLQFANVAGPVIPFEAADLLARKTSSVSVLIG